MKLLKFFKILIAVTALSLVYIHLQMQILDLAYQGKTKEKQIYRLADANGDITSNILTLKSANNLGVKFLRDDSGMTFADRTQIVKLESTESPAGENRLASAASTQRNAGFFGNLFTLTPQAEAKPLE